MGVRDVVPGCSRSRKSGLWRLLLTAMIVATIAPLSFSWGQEHAEPPERWPACDDSAAAQPLTFVHVADMHASYNPEGDGTSPVSRIRGYSEIVRRENPFTVFTNAGDDYEKGSIAEEMSHGRVTREVVQALGFDVRTIGNHDFAWGMQELLRFSNDSRALVLSSNTRVNGGAVGLLGGMTPGWRDFGIHRVGCVTIGFFGMTASPYGHDGRQHDGPVLQENPGLEVESDHVAIARQVIARHRQDVDILVMVSHLGLSADIRIAERTTGIDLILGGHSHTTMNGALRVNATDIVHTGSHARHIGRFDMLYDLNRRSVSSRSFQLVSNRPESITGDETFDQELANIIEPFRKHLKEPVVALTSDLRRPAMALLAARAAARQLKADAAFVSEGSVWNEWRRGGLTLQDIYSAFLVEREPVGTPGRTSLYLVKVKGADLLHARAVLADSAYCGPAEIDPDRVYEVALQKPQALGQREFFAWDIAASTPEPAAELWEIVAAYAVAQRERDLAIDDERDEGQSTENYLAYQPGHGRKDSVL